MSASEGFAHPEYLVEIDWLAAHLNDPDVVVLDCTVHLIPDPKITYTVKSGREDFEKGHIPGAQFVDLQEDLSAQHPKLRFMLPSGEAFAAAMGRFGVGERSRVVLYSTTTPQWATRIWWMLRNDEFGITHTPIHIAPAGIADSGCPVQQEKVCGTQVRC